MGFGDCLIQREATAGLTIQVNTAYEWTQCSLQKDLPMGLVGRYEFCAGVATLDPQQHKSENQECGTVNNKAKCMPIFQCTPNRTERGSLA